MRFGMLITASPESATVHTALRIARAALEAGHTVECFVMDDGVYNVLDTPGNPVAAALRQLLEAGGQITLCGSNCAPRGVTKENTIPGLIFGSQYDHAQILHRVDRFLVFN